MTITIDPEMEIQLRNVVQKLGTDAYSYVQKTLRRQILADMSRMDNEFDAEMQIAMNDPLFLEDLAEIKEAFASADAVIGSKGRRRNEIPFL